MVDFGFGFKGFLRFRFVERIKRKLGFCGGGKREFCFLVKGEDSRRKYFCVIRLKRDLSWWRGKGVFGGGGGFDC